MTIEEYRKLKSERLSNDTSTIQNYRKYKASVLSNINSQPEIYNASLPRANNTQLVKKEVTKPNIRLSDVPKIDINNIAEQSRGGMTSAQIRQQANLMQQQKALEKQQEQERWNNLSLGEKIADPFKTAGANIKFGDLGIEENIAWNEYRSKQDEESLKKAQEATRAREEYQLNNDRIGKGNAVTKDFAQYLPQLGGQLKSGIGGAAGGAGAGALGGAGVAFAAGQLGPQVVVPEEIATVPAGALTGAIWGGKTGYVAGTAKYGYDMMAGSAYKTLLDMGVPNDVALELSGDEALISSLIEGGGAIVDLITLGIGKLGSKGATTAGKELAKNRLLAAAKAYGVNLISEPIEEMAQEKVSIETEKKAADVSGIERTATDSEDWQRIKDAGETALKVAAVSGGLNAGGNYLTNTISENLTTNRDTLKLSPLDEATQNQLANINKNIEYQKQNESLANKQIQESVQNAKNNIEKSKTTLALPEGNRFYADENGVVVDSKNYVAPRQETLQTEEINKKNELINKINNNTYLPEEEKANLINQVNNSEYTEDFATGMEWLLKNVDEEFGLKNISNNFKDNKAKYGEYLRDETEYDKTQIDNAKNSVAANKSGRRTKEQWLQVAKNLGSQIYEMSDAEIEKLAYKTWMDNKPNNKDNLNRQGQKYVKFGLDEWVNTVYDEVKKYRAANPTQKVNNKLPTQAQNVKYSPVNAKQVLVNPKNTEVGKNVAPESPTNDFQEQGKQTILPTQKARKTYQSAKIAGMTDVDMKKAIDLNNMLRSGANLEFYDPQNIPQGVDTLRAADANGFYMNGTLWINKNSEMKVEKILGHELTHYVENDDLVNTILDSNIFYDFLAEKGFNNTAEFKTYLMEKKGYKQNELNSEMVAHFAEEKLFGKEETINRLARENRTLAQKILNWISDLRTKIAGSTEAKELLRIENMYRKALDQARNTTASTETQYSVGGVIGARNIQNNPEYRNIMADYREANAMLNNGANNSETIIKTGWYKDTDGNIKYEFTDEDMELKDSYKFHDNKIYPLDKILKHDILFEAYPQLRDYTVISMDIGDTHNAAIFSPLKVILLNNQKLKTKEKVEYSLIHEIQHAIQNIEGFPGARTNINGKYAYYTSLGEIESRDTSNRLRMLAEERRINIPETAKENPTHPSLENYLKNRKETDIEKDNKYIAKKERTEALKESVKKFMEGRIGFDDFEENNNSNIYKTTSEDDKLSSRTDGRGRLAGKEPAFSMPETDNQGRILSKEQQEFFKDSKVRDENGMLKITYHGTEANVKIPKEYWFTIFDIDKSDNHGNMLGDGFYFTEDKEHAKSYARDKGNIYETYLNIANPLEITEDENGVEMLKMLKEEANKEHLYLRSYLKMKGYDGIHTGKVYVAFDSNQIKNVDNTNPTENPDIRYSVNPVNIAKNPPNIETGLDQLNRAKRVKEGDSQSNFASNILNQSIFDEKFTNLALDDKNIRSYESISNKETLQEANDAINEQGQKWVDRFLDKPNGEMKATDIAGGIILMNRYQQVGDYESMIRVAEKLRKAGTQQGQTIQMFSVLGRMTPEGMTYYAQKELSKAYDEILKNKTQKWADEHADEFKLNEKDIEYIQRRVNQAAKLPEGRDKYILLAEIAERIQNKIPPQPGQGLKALARNSMLLNPKTMVRNILGNVVIAPNHIVSDFIGSKIDESISKKTGIRTTGGFDVKALQGAKKGFYESFDDFRREISTREMGGDRFEIGQGKNFYENHTGKSAETRNKINKALNGLDRVTGFLLEAGDRPFYETWFINSLNNQMKLNNVTEPTAEMIEIATDEALQRTWQDNNSYTRVVKSVRDGLNKLNVKGYGLGDMVMPFVKTPANLTKAVVDFSPLGAINAAVKTSQFNKDIGKGTATAKQQREVVKAWSQVITGSLGMAILTALANAGILSGGSDEDKDVRSFEQNILGIKPYSIKIGDKTYTYDWAQPLGTSAAMVADTVKSLKNAKDTEGKVAAILEGAQSGASVLLEQSFVSGIRNLFEEDNLINALIETGFNETSKFTPQFLSQLAQIQDDTARTSYVYNNIPKTALNKVKAKIPGLRETLEPSVDVLGREVKTDNSVGNVMFNPANTAFARTTEGAEEMYRVYQATGDKATIAQVAPYYFNVGTEKIVLTPKQRTQYQKTIGKIASDGVESLLKNKAYEQLEDTDKAEILKDLYSYGTAIAKAEASTSYLLPNDMKKIKDSGMKPEEYILLKYISNLGGTKKDEQYNSLTYAGYTPKETEEFLTDYKGYKFDNTSKNTLPTLKQQRAKLPTLKK